jgi:hypothetical protein
MLVDTLMHRCLFFSKTLYEKKVAPNDRQEFADQIFDDHNDAAAMSEFQDCWNNHVTFRADRKLPVAHGLRLVAGIGCGRASAAGEARPISSGLLRSMYDQQPQRSDQPGKSRLQPVCTVCAICVVSVHIYSLVCTCSLLCAHLLHILCMSHECAHYVLQCAHVLYSVHTLYISIFLTCMCTIRCCSLTEVKHFTL